MKRTAKGEVKALLEACAAGSRSGALGALEDLERRLSSADGQIPDVRRAVAELISEGFCDAAREVSHGGEMPFDVLSAKLMAESKLRSWRGFVAALDVPGEIAPAVQTGRPELIRLAKPRALTEGEAGALYGVIAGLIDTNQALQQHAAGVARLAGSAAGQAAGTVRMLGRIEDYAKFDLRGRDGQGEDGAGGGSPGRHTFDRGE
jgi:hypothetical protein